MVTARPDQQELNPAQLICFYNGFFVRGESLTTADLWINNATGKIVDPQEIFYDQSLVPATRIDLDGRILAPGLIDVQLNGASGFDISELPKDGDMALYDDDLQSMNRRLACTGVTSYLATMTSQPSEVYHKVRMCVARRFERKIIADRIWRRFFHI